VLGSGKFGRPCARTQFAKLRPWLYSFDAAVDVDRPDAPHAAISAAQASAAAAAGM